MMFQGSYFITKLYYEDEVISMLKILYSVFYLVKKVLEKGAKEYTKSKFARIGDKVYIGDNCIFTPNSIEIGDHVFIGSNAVFNQRMEEL
jgi:acetyltransferase-like isoleucine patch superfamily enzyme